MRSRRIGIGCAAWLLFAGGAVRAQPQALPPITGVWKLNVESSTNPNGPAPPARGARGRGGEGGGGIAGGSLGAEEMRRFEAMKAQFFRAPAMMGLQATATDFKILLDPATNSGYAHKTDNKKQQVNTPAGPAEFRVKWDGPRIKREIETPDTLHVVEEYSVSADGKQLVVTVKADSRMVRNVQLSEIRRVYDRQQ